MDSVAKKVLVDVRSEVSFTSNTGESDLDRLREAAATVIPNFTSTPDKLTFKMEREEWEGRLVNVFA